VFNSTALAFKPLPDFVQLRAPRNIFVHRDQVVKVQGFSIAAAKARHMNSPARLSVSGQRLRRGLFSMHWRGYRGLKNAGAGDTVYPPSSTVNRAMHAATSDQLSFLDGPPPEWLRVRDVNGKCLRAERLAEGIAAEIALAEEMAACSLDGWTVEELDATEKQFTCTKGKSRRVVEIVNEEPPYVD
jgi:hypothetical protein